MCAAATQVRTVKERSRPFSPVRDLDVEPFNLRVHALGNFRDNLVAVPFESKFIGNIPSSPEPSVESQSHVDRVSHAAVHRRAWRRTVAIDGSLIIWDVECSPMLKDF